MTWEGGTRHSALLAARVLLGPDIPDATFGGRKVTQLFAVQPSLPFVLARLSSRSYCILKWWAEQMAKAQLGGQCLLGVSGCRVGSHLAETLVCWHASTRVVAFLFPSWVLWQWIFYLKAGLFIFRVAIAISSQVIYLSRFLRHRFLIEYYGIFFNIFLNFILFLNFT